MPARPADRFGLGVVTGWFFVGLVALVGAALVLARRLVETPADDRVANRRELRVEPDLAELALERTTYGADELRKRQDRRAVVGDRDRVLEVRGARSVGGDDRPAVVERAGGRPGPAVTIGSIASTIPARNFMPRPGGP